LVRLEPFAVIVVRKVSEEGKQLWGEVSLAHGINLPRKTSAS
jgi:hypothetical protein